ncbi:zinc-binding dehydrogenase [uncultured Traorella sp.]|uniref:zinc-dependent alcohol dehydrogenase n=1 Tax=uncultured Traorella sp. TaxID=1929048 RepID=UPI0025E135F8|nr:zinc-binding dehydrogenase [uncultured Traorella sp.]
MEGMMKCAIYKSAKNIVVEERAIPSISSKDVLVKVLRAGICGSDVGIYLHGGEGYGLPSDSQFGHEMIGRIVEKGSDVADDLNVGDVVFIDPTLSTENGVAGSTAAGAFCEYALVKNAALNYNLYHLEDPDLDKLAIIEPLCVGTKAATMVEPKLDEKVVVLGAGTIGLSAAASLIARGLKKIVVVDRDSKRLEVARHLGAETVNTTEKDLKEELIRILGAFPGYFPLPDVDMFIEASGSSALFRQCFDLAREKTRYAVVSVLNEVTLNGLNFIATQPVIYGSRGYEHETIAEVIDHLQKNKTNIREIVTKKYKIDDFPQAIADAASGKQIKVLIDYEME